MPRITNASGARSTALERDALPYLWFSRRGSSPKRSGIGNALLAYTCRARRLSRKRPMFTPGSWPDEHIGRSIISIAGGNKMLRKLTFIAAVAAALALPATAMAHGGHGGHG
jgi:hypothetical protein